MTSFSISNLLDNPSRFGFIVLIYHTESIFSAARLTLRPTCPSAARLFDSSSEPISRRRATLASMCSSMDRSIDIL